MTQERQFQIRPEKNVADIAWTSWEKLGFRAAVVFTLIAVFPISLDYLTQLIAIKWSTLNYTDVDLISNYYPWYVDAPYKDADGHNYWQLLLAVAISLIAAIIWGLADKKTSNYNRYWYWLNVVIRYKVAGVMLYFAFVKVFPVQMPFPSLSQLNTLVGDYTPGRLFWITTGSSAVYEVFGGLVELTGTLLLLHRRTATLGALVLLAVMLPVIMINIGYDAGVQIKAILIVLLLTILVINNLKPLYDFFIKNKSGRLNFVPFRPISQSGLKKLRLGIKIAFILFFVGFRGVSVAYSFFTGKSYKRPSGNGLANVRGLYHVDSFSVNGTLIPFNPLDSVRWQNVVFERWNTISIKQHSPVLLQASNLVRKTEIHSNVGRHYYDYNADTLAHTLTLKNRANPADSLKFVYVRNGEKEIHLIGKNAHGDSLRLSLQRIDREYPLEQGRHPKDYITY